MNIQKTDEKSLRDYLIELQIIAADCPVILAEEILKGVNKIKNLMRMET
jgi:hypothetical protein